MPTAQKAKVAKATRGSKPGERRGGRVKGVPNKATREIKAIAQQYSVKAVKALVEVMESGESEAARVSAANAILDRAYGKPSQSVEHSGVDGAPIQHALDVSDEVLASIALGKK
ncbi:hypothetical protein HNQ99_002683 [Rhizorhapis suberifaciens]|uniref:DUF5681 domain-containing protein n=1 Tax=Rhizorhapis suberifaciens TaxID=13656 RepID=A0A840HXW4_9SPHN|nr:hypothetical protein [Rhizorhapis suberifaciens]